MRFLLVFLLLLASFVSNGEEDTRIQGNLRIYLPKFAEINSLIINLVERQNLPHTNVISQQQCSNPCVIALPYAMKDINQSKHYQVNISISYNSNKKEKTYKTSFPVLTFDNPQKLNVVVSIPPEPIAGEAEDSRKS